MLSRGCFRSATKSSKSAVLISAIGRSPNRSINGFSRYARRGRPSQSIAGACWAVTMALGAVDGRSFRFRCCVDRDDLRP